jgi:DNA-directed RNA polymerase specialized sigma subunit
MTQTDVAERLGCSQMQVSRLQARALNKIRVFLENAAAPEER